MTDAESLHNERDDRARSTHTNTDKAMTTVMPKTFGADPPAMMWDARAVNDAKTAAPTPLRVRVRLAFIDMPVSSQIHGSAASWRDPIIVQKQTTLRSRRRKRRCCGSSVSPTRYIHCQAATGVFAS